MFDLKAIRENPDYFDGGWQRRGLSPQSEDILVLDEKRRAVQTKMQELQNQRNAASKDIGKLKSEGKDDDAQALMDEVGRIKEDVQKLEEEERGLSEELMDKLSRLPNIPDADVPDGKDEGDNVEVRRYLEPPRDNDIQDHQDLGEALGMMDFETAAHMSGSRFVVLKDGIARLERALAQFMLDLHTLEHGYTEVSVPLLVRDNAMYGAGQLPKFADDAFHTTRGDWLIPTSEVALANLLADQIVDAAELPLRFTAFSPCFRQEAGAAGKDTRGMLRQHQFYKVEMFSFTKPEDSAAELERMTECAENVLKKLEIPYRTMMLCTGDMGFGAAKTYDIEAWIPAQNTYREISSCSNCRDFQARRMKARFRHEGQKDIQFAHTLNGSGLATGRTLITVLENYQQADGSVVIPDVLRPYMGGLEKLGAGTVNPARVANN